MMRKFFMAILLTVSIVSYGQKPVDSLAIRQYVDSINILLKTWTHNDPVLTVETSGKTMILHRDGSRFVFNMGQLADRNYTEGEQFHGIELNRYDPRTRPAEQHFIYFNYPEKSGGFIRFGKIPGETLQQIYGLLVSLRKLFL